MPASTNFASSPDAKYYVASQHFCPYYTPQSAQHSVPSIENPALALSGHRGRQSSTFIDCPPDKGAPVSEAPTSVGKPKLAKSTVSPVSTSSPFELPKFDLSKFEVPNVEVPAAFREI